jgi:phage terminase small subunit
MAPLRNARHERFAQDIAAGKSLEEAYRLAGYKPDRRNAQTLRKRADISRRIYDILRMREREEAKTTEHAIERAAISKEWVIEKLRENVERAMTATPVVRDGNPTGEYMYNGTVANKALELLGPEIGMFIARSEVGKPGDFSELSDGELADRIVDELVRGGVPADIARAFGEASWRRERSRGMISNERPAQPWPMSIARSRRLRVRRRRHRHQHLVRRRCCLSTSRRRRLPASTLRLQTSRRRRISCMPSSAVLLQRLAASCTTWRPAPTKRLPG